MFDHDWTTCNRCRKRIPRDYDHQCGSCGEHVCNDLDDQGKRRCTCKVCDGADTWCVCGKKIGWDEDMCDECSKQFDAMLESAKGIDGLDSAGSSVSGETE